MIAYQVLGEGPFQRGLLVWTSGLESPTGRLATAEGGISYPGGSLFKGLTQGQEQDRPALLVSYVYLKPFLANKHRYNYRNWVMDSGAFSAHNSGTDIKLQDYIDICKKLSIEDKSLVEIYSLDVIGDWKASLKNCEAMWAQGVQAIPCFHVGEPESILKGLAKDYPKVALGGCVGFKDKDKFAAQCFSRIWPKKIHGFGFGSEKSVMALPWHSVDATNWEIGPCKFGRWNSYGKMSVRGSKQNLRAEVEWYLDLEKRARARWANEMKKLEASGSPIIRLTANGHAEKRGPKSGSLDRQTDREHRDKIGVIGNQNALSIKLALSGVHSKDKKYALGDEKARD